MKLTMKKGILKQQENIKKIKETFKGKSFRIRRKHQKPKYMVTSLKMVLAQFPVCLEMK